MDRVGLEARVPTLPGWYTPAAAALAGAFGGAVGAVWWSLRPLGSPGMLGLGTLSLAAGLAGTAAALRPAGVLPRALRTHRRLHLRLRAMARLAPEVVVGLVATALLTRHVFGFVAAFLFVRALRRVAFAAGRRLASLCRAARPAPGPTAATRMRRLVLVAGALVVLCLLVRTATGASPAAAPLLLVAAVSGLVLVSGTEHETRQAGFRRAGAAAESGFSRQWWGGAIGVLAVALLLAALLPSPPTGGPVHRLAHAFAAWQSHALAGGLPVAPSAPTPPASPGHAPPRLAALAVRLGLALALGSAIAYAVYLVLLLRLPGRARRRSPLALWTLVRDALSFAVSLARALVSELRREWLAPWRALWGALRAALAAMASVRLRWPRRRRTAVMPVHMAGADARRGRRGSATAWGLPPGDPRRRVREVYRQFLLHSARAGLGRDAGQTPAAHGLAVSAAEPGTATGLAALTGVYQEARFSPHEVTREHVAAARSAWTRIAAALAGRARRARA